MTDTKNSLSNWLKNNVKKDIPYVFYNGYADNHAGMVSAFISTVHVKSNSNYYCHLHVVDFGKDKENPNIVYDGLFYSAKEANEKLSEIVKIEKLTISKKILKTSIDILKENARKHIQFDKLDIGLYWPLTTEYSLLNKANRIIYTK